MGRVLVILLLAWAQVGHADEPVAVEPPAEEQAPPPPPPPPPPEPYLQPLPPLPPPYVVPQSRETLLAEAAKLQHSGRKMRIGGALMLAFGIAAEVTGMALVLYSELTPSALSCTGTGANVMCTTDTHTPELISGIVLGLVGGGTIYGATAVMSAGSARLRRAEIIRYRLGLRPELSSNYAGAKLTLQF